MSAIAFHEMQALIEAAEKLPVDGVTDDAPAGAGGANPPAGGAAARKPPAKPQTGRKAPNDRDRNMQAIAGAGGCQVMAEFVAGARQSEPEWHFSANVSSYCRDGREFFLKHSAHDPRFNEAEAAGKFDIEVEQDKPPQLCGKFDQCSSCPHMGIIKTPVSLGDREPTWLTEMNRQYAQVRDGKKLTIIDFHSVEEVKYGVQDAPGPIEATALKDWWKGQGGVKMGESYLPRGDAWLKHPGRRRYDGMVFQPGIDLPPNILNLWRGFAIEAREGDASRWLDTAAEVFPDQQERDYAINWLAWRVQNPGEVPGTLLVVTGGMGAGKNSLVGPVLTAFGRHGGLFDNSGQVAGRFNSHLRQMSLAILDEAIFVHDPQQVEMMRSRVTGDRMNFEAKGIDSVQGYNRCAYVVLTNHAHAWQAQIDDRRAAILTACDALMGPAHAAYWRAHHRWLEHEGGNEAVLHYLLNLDVSGFDVKTVPRGEGRRQQVELSSMKDPYTAFMADVLDTGVIEWREASGSGRRELLQELDPLAITKANLLLALQQSPHARRLVHGTSSAMLGRKLKEWFKEDLRTASPRTGAPRVPGGPTEQPPTKVGGFARVAED